MLISVSHPTYGVISYDENAWTGKKTILFDGVPLIKTAKNTYQLPATAETPAQTVTVKGSYVGGVSLIVEGEVIVLTGKPSAADYILGILPAALFFALIMQGAIGGAIAGMMGFGGILLMKSRKNLKQKLLISLGASAVIVAIGVALIIAIVNSL
jgi:hypothetical protein